MKKLYNVKLTEQERKSLKKKLRSGQTSARILKRIAVLIKADEGLNDKTIAKEVMLGHRTVERVRKRFCEEGLARLLSNSTPKRIYKRKFDGEQEAHVIAVACSPAPDGVGKWSLRLLADKVVELEIVDELAPETLRQLLKKTNLSPNSISTGV
jgi:transposase